MGVGQIQLYDEIALWAKERDELVAYSCDGFSLSYQELITEVEQLAESLSRAGVVAGSVFAFKTSSGPEFIIALLAGLKLRLIVAPIAVALPRAEQEVVFATLEPRYFLSEEKDKKQAEFLSTAISSTPISSHFRLYDFEKETSEQVSKLCPNGGCVRYTSGTTGESKGVIISAESAYARVVAAEAFFQIAPGERVASLLAMPYHFVVSLLHFLRAGACVVQPKNSAPSEMVRCFEEGRCQVIYGSPFHFDMLVGAASSCSSELRLAVSTCSALRRDTAKRFFSKFDKQISDSYGVIEIGIPISVMATPGESSVGIGSALPGYEVCVESERGIERVGRGTLLIRGPGMFDAYLKPFRPSQQVLKDGWFETGDLAEIDSLGQISIYGRTNSAIHIAGFKVFPEEVESVLLEHENISEAQVCGVVHPSFGNTIHAKVVVSNDAKIEEDVLMAHCRERLGALKTPHSLEFTDKLKRTPTGKLRRRN